MLIRRQDLSVLLFYYLGYSIIRNLIFRFQRKPVARFVAFHDILPENSGNFKTNLKFLKQRTNVVNLDDFFSDRLSFEKINTVITFDDGYKSWVTDAVPLLKELGLPAAFFISSGFVGLSKGAEADFKKSKLFRKLPPRKITGTLSYEDVKRIVDEGFIVGGHTLNHCNLSQLSNRDQIKHEIAEDKTRLEELTGKKIEYFAYPGGDYYNPVVNLTKVLKKSGYRGAVTAVSGFNNISTEPYLLHRELTADSMHPQVFRARVFGNYDAVMFLKKLMRIILKH